MSLTETAIKTSPTEYKGETVENWRSAKEYFLFSALIKWSLSNHLQLQLFWHVLTNKRKQLQIIVILKKIHRSVYRRQCSLHWKPAQRSSFH